MYNNKYVLSFLGFALLVGAFSMVLFSGAEGHANQQPQIDSNTAAIEDLQTRVAVLEGLHGIGTEEPTATPTEVPPTATATEVPPTATEIPPTATPTDEPQVCNMGDAGNTWHSPTDHEHGDAPPQWAIDFSCENFGHTVLYGGDEGTPNENVYKHRGFKGYHVNFNGVELYFRNHLMSNPLGHSGRFHSYEVYARDASGNVSFWQGHLDYGDDNPNTGTLLQEPNVVAIDACESNPRPVISVNTLDCYAQTGTYGFEAWYSRAGGNGSWSWDTGVNLHATYFHDGDPQDPSTWTENPYGLLGLTRRVELAWYDARSDFALQQAGVGRDEWFCADVHGNILGSSADGTGTGCASGLPQYIASTMTEVSFPGNAVQKDYPGGGTVQLPN